MKQLLMFFVIFFVLVMLFMYLFQRHLIYYPSTEIPQLSMYQASDMQAVTIHTKDDLTLNAWYKKAQPNHSTVLLLHGNAGHIGNRMYLARPFINAGLGVLLLEYRGYGGNKGSPTEQGLYKDGEAALSFLHSQGIKSKQIVVYGESLGSGVATKLAVDHSFCAVVLQSPFTSLTALARYHYPWVFIKPKDRFESVNRIKNLKAPLLVLHGQKDTLVPYAQGLFLFQQAPEPKKMLTIPLANHNDIMQYQNVIKNIVKFIELNC